MKKKTTIIIKKIVNNNNNNDMEKPKKESNTNINYYVDNNIKNIPLNNSFLFKIKNANNISKSFKTKILFKNKKKDIKSNFNEAKFLRKNYHEIMLYI